MAGFGDIVQKAFYLGVGIASVAQEKAGARLVELRSQAQKLADELVARGEMTTEEAKRMVDEFVIKAQQQTSNQPTSESQRSEPRRIEILSDDDSPSEQPLQAVDDLKAQVAKLQEELRRLQQ